MSVGNFSTFSLQSMIFLGELEKMSLIFCMESIREWRDWQPSSQKIYQQSMHNIKNTGKGYVIYVDLKFRKVKAWNPIPPLSSTMMSVLRKSEKLDKERIRNLILLH